MAGLGGAQGAALRWAAPFARLVWFCCRPLEEDRLKWSDTLALKERETLRILMSQGSSRDVA